MLNELCHFDIYIYITLPLNFQLIQYQEQSNLAFFLLIKAQQMDEPLNMAELMA